jgi:membrane protease YdiL (CAAX protease family)
VHARATAALGASLCFALGAALVAVQHAERGERDLDSALGAGAVASPSLRVARAERVVVEVCVSPAPAAAALIPIVVEAPNASAPQVVVAVRALGGSTLVEARRDAEGACWTAYDATVPRDGAVRVRLADVEDLEHIALVASLHARATPSGWWRAAIVLVGLAALLFALGLTLAPLPVDARDGVARPRVAVLVALTLAAMLVAAASQGVRYIGGAGAAGGLARGLWLAFVEVVVALAAATWLARRSGDSTLSWLGAHRPRGGALMLAAAPLVGVSCAFVATWLLRVVPSSPGEAPITLFVARPSGALAFGVLALSAPLAEELFFRGFVQGAATRALGRAAAVGVSAALFTLAHAQQAWGAWGGLVAVAWLGIALALLRATTRSSAATMVAHLAYNVVLTVPGWG